ncbi:MAG: SPOR domain-containing protein [Burkholderiales bacterium]|nr:SPOR domain-containing protein [Burkholderiales bacterium]
MQQYPAPSSAPKPPPGAQYINEGEFVIAGGQGAIPPPPVVPPRKPSGFAIQLGAFRTPANADALAHRANEILTLSEPDARVVEIDGWYKVLVGGNMDRPKADSYVVKLSKELGQQGFVVKDI